MAFLSASPSSQETATQRHLLTSAYYDFFRSTLSLNEFAKKVSEGLLPASMKRKRILQMVHEMQQAWMQLVPFLFSILKNNRISI